MKLIKRLLSVLLVLALSLSLSACGSFEDKAKSNINTYMKKLKGLTQDNYVTWVTENLDNPYTDYGLSFDQIRNGQITYFVECLGKIEYEIVSIDETNKIAEVNVTYVDSTEYITNLFTQLMTYAFSEDYSEEGENQIYLDVMNSITEYQYINDVIYFGLNDDGSINATSTNIFDVATAGLYVAMLGDPSETTTTTAKYTSEELINNLVITCEAFDESNIMLTITNNNEVAVYPIINLCFKDSDGNEVIRSQANIEALPAGATNYASAYNEIGTDGAVSYDLEIEIEYYEDDSITFFDESLIPYEIKQEEDMVSINFTNNTGETINICGGYMVYGEDGQMIYIGDIYIWDLAPEATDCCWFYLNSEYDEANDTWVVQPYASVELYPIAHTDASAIWCN